MLRLDWRLFLVVVLILQAGFDLYAGLRLHTTYQNSSEIALLRTEFDDHLKTDKVLYAAMQEWLKAIDAALYAPIPEKPVPAATRKPTAVETWQLNRDKELRERINRLEQWRLRQESR
jgi:hypothetical protein